MTIKAKKELSLDLLGNPDWPRFFQGAVASKAQPLAAYSLDWSQPGGRNDGLMQIVSKELENSIDIIQKELRVSVQALFWLHSLQPKSAVVTHKKLWKRVVVNSSFAGVTFGDETLIECGSEVRFAGLATVEPCALPWLIEALKTNTVVPLLMSSPLSMDSEKVLELMRVGCPPQGCGNSFDWRAFVCHMSANDGIVVQHPWFGSYEEVFANFYMNQREVASLVRTLAE
jgi:hypothetical protein